MAKVFYTFEEARDKLRCADDDIKKLIEDGKLREFRDGAKIMFKVDEVDNLAPEDIPLSGSTGAELSPEDSALPIDLSSEGSGSAIGLTPLDSGSAIGLSPLDSADHISLDDTTSAAEEPDKDDTVVTGHGVDVFDESDDDLAAVDPLAQTQLAPDIADQIELDSGSSGSGLLDLSREADDTSLGAELLEEIYPGDEAESQPQAPSQLEMAAEAEAPAVDIPPVMAAPEPAAPALAAYDPSSGIYGAMMVIPFIMLMYLACVAIAGSADLRPSLLEGLTPYVTYVVGAALLVTVLVLAIGHFMSTAAAREPGAQGPKTAKPKKPKAKKAKKAPKAK